MIGSTRNSEQHSHFGVFPGRLMFMFLVATAIVPVECASAKFLALIGGTVFTSPYTDPIEKGVVLLNDDRIVSVGLPDSVDVPAGAATIDVSGLYITAGYWNSHVHYIKAFQELAWGEAARLNEIVTDSFLRWGFVNTVNLGSWLPPMLRIRKRIRTGEINGPRILTVASGFTPQDASPFYVGAELPQFHGPEDAREKVFSTLDAGVDAIKLFTGSWASRKSLVIMKSDEVRAATKAAHERGALVFAHPADSEGARVAVENGVDVLAHVFPWQMKGPWDESLPAEMASQDVALIPTLMLWRPTLTRNGMPSEKITRIEKTALAQARAIHEAGATILFGTDVGFMQEVDPTNEFHLMEQAGMDYKDILASLTTAPVARYGFADSEGRIEKSFVADLVLLGSNPRVDVTAYADVVMTIRGGRIVFRR